MKGIERQIAASLINLLLDAGCTISVSDGDAHPVVRSTNTKKILDSLHTTDKNDIIAHRGDNTWSWFWLIWGNGEDLISDYSNDDFADNIYDELSTRLHL